MHFSQFSSPLKVGAGLSAFKEVGCGQIATRLATMLSIRLNSGHKDALHDLLMRFFSCFSVRSCELIGTESSQPHQVVAQSRGPDKRPEAIVTFPRRFRGSEGPFQL